MNTPRIATSTLAALCIAAAALAQGSAEMEHEPRGEIPNDRHIPLEPEFFDHQTLYRFGK